MDQQYSFHHNHLVQIKHCKTNRLLKGTIHAYKEGFLKKKDTDEFYLGTTLAYDDFYTYFQIEKQVPTTSELSFGDLVAIRNYANQLFISLNSAKKSESSKQCYAFMGEQSHCFVIQPEQEVCQNNKLDNSITQKPFRLVSADLYFCLHSHDICYKNEDVDQYNEVTGFDGFDDNDLWQLIHVPDGIVKNFSITPIKYEPIYICNKDTIVIRNLWTGFTLHSHKEKYKSTSEQEVTLFSYPRDKNDEWIIVKSGQSQQNFVFIDKKDQIILQHKFTMNFLSCSKSRTYSNSGLQAFCSSKGSNITFSLEQFDGCPLELNKPFAVKLSSENIYLAQTKNKAESKVGSQQEAAFIPELIGRSIWIIEQRKK